jgi:Ca2+/H+ antiporter, TMEM165/GDT1 family
MIIRCVVHSLLFMTIDAASLRRGIAHPRSLALEITDHAQTLSSSASSLSEKKEEPHRSDGGPIERMKRSVATMPENQHQFRSILAKTFCVVSVAELFDKTWFVSLLCAMNYGRQIAFWSAFSALSLHVFLAAALGVCISAFFTLSQLCFSTSAIFAFLASLYIYDFIKASAEDSIEDRSNEAKEALKNDADGEKRTLLTREMAFRCFTAVFVAEFGDRTQIAMVSLHSSAPWVPVCLGSLVAFFALTLSAVLTASLLEGQRLSERLVSGVSAISFLAFACLSLRDGVLAQRTI